MESGTLALTVQPTELGELVPRCLALSEPAARARTVDVRYELEEAGHLKVDGRPATPRAGAVQLAVERDQVQPPRWLGGGAGMPTEGGTVELAIADSGEGMTQEQQSQLFQPFNRLGRTDGDGTGIGLVICKQLVEGMGGVISVTSRPDEGTVFSLRLTYRPGLMPSIKSSGRQNF